MIITASPLASLSVKLMAPYTNAALCCKEMNKFAQTTGSFVLRLGLSRTSYRLICNELRSHGERYDQDGGGPGPQQHGRPIYLLTHGDVQQHPIRERHDQQQAHEVSKLDQSEDRRHMTVTHFCLFDDADTEAITSCY